MVYSATAAVHSLVLAAIRKSLYPDAMINNYEVVLVQGQSASGRYGDYWTDHDPVWVPVLPMAADNDADPVLAIVGTAFLLLLPMQIWSRTLRTATTQRRRVVLAWALLLFAGLIAALINVAYSLGFIFPQLRFCPMDREDPLPLTSPGVDDGVQDWDYMDRYRWNRTVADHFVHGNRSGPVSTACFYPCFARSSPLRDRADIYVVEWGYGEIIDTSIGIGVVVAAYVMVSLFTACSLTVASLANIACIPRNWRTLNVKSSTENIRGTWFAPALSSSGRAWRVSLRLWIFYNLVVARWLSFPIILAFVCHIEWLILTADPGAESFNLIGQWGVLAGALLVLLAAAISGVKFRALVRRIVKAFPGPVVRRHPRLRRAFFEQEFERTEFGQLQRRHSV
jgi:hypothetical protein